MNRRKSFGYRVKINSKEHTTSVVEEINGKESAKPSYLGCDGNYYIASACRYIAYRMLEKAFHLEHSDDFIMPDFDINAEIDKMISEFGE